MAGDQTSDPEVQALRTAVSGLRLEDIKLDSTGAMLLCDVSTGQPRPVVPGSWRRQVFDAMRGLAHHGRRPLQQLVAEKSVWHGLTKDVGDWARACVVCQHGSWHIFRRRSGGLTM